MCLFDNALLRTVGIFLVVNSHLDHLYPWPELGTGGSLGNAIFFMMSGYGLALSNRQHGRSFPEWYWRRFARIYPSLFLVMLVLAFFPQRGWQSWSLNHYLSNFLWPLDSYWFLTALMVFYVPFYFIMKLRKASAYAAAFCCLFVPYFGWYLLGVDLSCYSIEGPTYFKWVFYLQTMLLGGFLATSRFGESSARPSLGVQLVLLLAVYFVLGFAIHHARHMAKYQFLIHLITFPILYLLLEFCRTSRVVQAIEDIPTLRHLVFLIGGSTLEVYLLQGSVYTSSLVNSSIFPVNLALFWFIVIALAVGLAKIADAPRHMLLRQTGPVGGCRLQSSPD